MIRTCARLLPRPAPLALLVAFLSACGADPGVHTSSAPGSGDASQGPTAPPAPSPAPAPQPETPAEPSGPPASEPRVAVRQFTCLGMLTPAQTRQRITGGLTASDEPVDVAFVRASSGLVLAAGAEPSLAPDYDAGYWKLNYGYDAWTVASTLDATFTLLFPRGPYPLRFTAMAIVDYGDFGNYQDELTCGLR